MPERQFQRIVRELDFLIREKGHDPEHNGDVTALALTHWSLNQWRDLIDRTRQPHPERYVDEVRTRMVSEYRGRYAAQREKLLNVPRAA